MLTIQWNATKTVTLIKCDGLRLPITCFQSNNTIAKLNR